jgi:hypothetical protein
MLPDAIKQGAVEPILFWIVEISYQVNYIVFIYKLFKWQSRLHDKLAFPDWGACDKDSQLREADDYDQNGPVFPFQGHLTEKSCPSKGQILPRYYVYTSDSYLDTHFNTIDISFKLFKTYGLPL